MKCILKNLESSRINRQNIYWTWLKNNKLGLEEDMRALIYDRLKEASHDDLKAFAGGRAVSLNDFFAFLA